MLVDALYGFVGVLEGLVGALVYWLGYWGALVSYWVG
jgi:hypothetical protein